MADDGTVYLRYLIDDVDAAADFYVTHLGFELVWSAGAAFAEIARGNHLHVDDIASEVERLGAAGVTFRSGIVTGPGGSQIVFDDPSGNPVELFQPSR